ncbi:GNAT family N-acetyltransferase [Trinickia diaoshuihuensis]|uniref:GNAT family N-acetyltransferase n=1 Tax=Trinickia diaoshuihuensis TaxID=2292265 RepID=UPI000E2864ED|nr:GNAT family N-acetyltransferase [Trinickia diaoshuihuensis]
MNDWLRNIASQHQKKNLSRTYVAIRREAPDQVIGYYALAAFLIETEGMPGKRLPDRVSAVLLARLAIDNGRQGRGLGAHLLMHALDTALTTSEAVGVQCVVADAIDERAAGFYRKYGFQPFTQTPRRLFLPIETIRQA